MESYNYPVDLSPGEDTDAIVAALPDFPEAATFGADQDDALRHVGDLLEAALGGRMAHTQDIPRPSPAHGRPTLTLPARIAAKVALYRAMRQSGVTKSELGHRLGWHRPQVQRLLDLDHGTRIDHLERALALFGKRLDVRVRDAA